ncbi:MAG: DUF4197 domain-containing protein [Cryomorphaceae bacterium]|nr:DUF4197 domain-containing protein [Cryomorphaceae bacterium]
MKKSIVLSLVLALGLFSCDELFHLTQQIPTELGPPTQTEVVGALKDALIVGMQRTVAETSKENGYYGNDLIRIPFPPEAQQVESALKGIGMNSLIDDFVVSMNRGAEVASKKALDVFVSSIRQMTITDAMDIWKGEEDAATQYLKRTSFNALMTEFRPIIRGAIDEVEVTKFWNPVVSQYNRIPFTKTVNPDLENYIAEQAIDGLFLMVAKEEKTIRENPAARTTELLRRVFGYEG